MDDGNNSLRFSERIVIYSVYNKKYIYIYKNNKIIVVRATIRRHNSTHNIIRRPVYCGRLPYILSRADDDDVIISLVRYFSM